MSAADEAERRVVEIVAVEIVDDGAERARRHERVVLLVLEEHAHARVGVLIAVVLADDAAPGDRIIRLSDA